MEPEISPLRALVEELGELAVILGEATGAERTHVYARPGLRLDYDPYGATADLSRVADWCDRGFAAQHTPSTRK